MTKLFQERVVIDDLIRAAMPTIDLNKWREPITDTSVAFNIRDERFCMLLAQIGHESSDLKRLQESLTYTTPERLMQVWPTRFRTRESALPFVRNPVALANHVYGSRMGNRGGNDGWDFRGKGAIQLTGRSNYERFTREVGLDVVSNPELLVDDPHATMLSACWYFETFTTGTDIRQVTRQVNGGQHGLEDRRTRYERALRVYRDITA